MLMVVYCRNTCIGGDIRAIAELETSPRQLSRAKIANTPEMSIPKKATCWSYQKEAHFLLSVKNAYQRGHTPNQVQRQVLLGT